MPHVLISLPTYTAAAAACDLLAKHRINTDIVRSQADKNTSCGYSVKVDSRRANDAQRLLKISRFPVRGVTPGR